MHSDVQPTGQLIIGPSFQDLKTFKFRTPNSIGIECVIISNQLNFYAKPITVTTKSGDRTNFTNQNKSS